MDRWKEAEENDEATGSGRVGFVNRAFGLDQRLVQVEQCVAQLLERLPDGCISFSLL